MRWNRRPHPSAELEAAAQLCATLAACLRAGLTPDRTLEVAGITATDDRIRDSVGGLVGRCWDLATETGAAPAAFLSQLGQTFSSISVALGRAELHAVGPRATLHLVIWLPVLSLGAAQLAGVPALSFLVTNSLGWILLVTGCALLFGARSWLNRLVRQAQHFSWARGCAPELLAMVLRSGLAPDRAHELLSSIPRTGYRDEADLSADAASCVTALAQADEWGIPAAALLDLRAQQMREEQFRQWDEAGRILSVRVMVPLGVCVLPAFILLAVVPAVLSLVSSTGLGLR